MTYGRMTLPPPQHVIDVNVRLELVRVVPPAPALGVLVLGQGVAVDVGAAVAPPVRPALDLVDLPRPGHADVHRGVDGPPVPLRRRRLLALTLTLAGRRLVPQGGHELAHALVVYADGLRVDEDAGFGDGEGSGSVGAAGLGGRGRERGQVGRQGLCDLVRRVDGVLLSEWLKTKEEQKRTS